MRRSIAVLLVLVAALAACGGPSGSQQAAVDACQALHRHIEMVEALPSELDRPTAERRIGTSLAHVARAIGGELGADLRLLADAAHGGAEMSAGACHGAIERVERRCGLRHEG